MGYSHSLPAHCSCQIPGVCTAQFVSVSRLATHPLPSNLHAADPKNHTVAGLPGFCKFSSLARTDVAQGNLPSACHSGVRIGPCQSCTVMPWILALSCCF